MVSLSFPRDPSINNLSRTNVCTDTRSYVPPVQIGEVMRGFALCKILHSKSPKFNEGQYVTCTPGWTELAILNAKDITALELPSEGRLTDAMGVLGMTGLTAYFGMLHIGEVKAGDFVVVSGAAGATGSVACQLAKIKGARVLGLAGSDDKVAWLKEMGCDEALNYKAEGFAKMFREKTGSLIDVFFDNVGGEILELALSRAKPHARFVMCGGEYSFLPLIFWLVGDVLIKSQLSVNITPRLQLGRRISAW